MLEFGSLLRVLLSDLLGSRGICGQGQGRSTKRQGQRQDSQQYGLHGEPLCVGIETLGSLKLPSQGRPDNLAHSC